MSDSTRVHFTTKYVYSIDMAKVELANKRNPKNTPLYLQLNSKNIAIEDALALLDIILTVNSEPNINLELAGNDLNDLIAFKLADILKSPNCPENFTVDLSNNNISLAGITAIAEAWCVDNHLKHFAFSISDRGFGLEGMEAIARSLTHKLCAENLTIDIYSDTPEASSEVLIRALKDLVFSFGTRIYFMQCPRINFELRDICLENDKRIEQQRAEAMIFTRPKAKFFRKGKAQTQATNSSNCVLM